MTKVASCKKALQYAGTIKRLGSPKTGYWGNREPLKTSI